MLAPKNANTMMLTTANNAPEHVAAVLKNVEEWQDRLGKETDSSFFVMVLILLSCYDHSIRQTHWSMPSSSSCVFSFTLYQHDLRDASNKDSKSVKEIVADNANRIALSCTETIPYLALPRYNP